VVLRPSQPARAAPLLEQLQALNLCHVEIAWSKHPDWSDQSRALIEAFPDLSLGAASVCTPQAIAAAAAAGFRYAVAPILQRSLLHQASAAGLTLVPGVMTASEVHRARRWGARIVKLFPAAPLGPHYWRRMGDPLGDPLPFCIAAGGLGPSDVLPWLRAGVDAVALGSSLLNDAERFDPMPLTLLMAALSTAG
jgi:2-dehydro-3-deoxyphosphogluconate aldolase/(4S)-4-hydroxy-2-oxoglutarate aldolase